MAFARKRADEVGVKAALPSFVAPALATSVDWIPSGDRWIHEIKFDGYRVQVHLANEAVTVYTRRVSPRSSLPATKLIGGTASMSRVPTTR